MPPVLITPRNSTGGYFYERGKSAMLSNECIVAVLRELPGFAEIVVRFFYDLAMHAIGLLGAL